MATTDPGTTALVPGPQTHQFLEQRLLFFFRIAIVLILTPSASTFIVHRLHLTFDFIAVRDPQFTGKQLRITHIHFTHSSLFCSVLSWTRFRR